MTSHRRSCHAWSSSHRRAAHRQPRARANFAAMAICPHIRKKIFPNWRRTRNSGSVVRRRSKKHDGLPKPISDFGPWVRDTGPILTPAQGALTRTVRVPNLPARRARRRDHRPASCAAGAAAGLPRRSAASTPRDDARAGASQPARGAT